MKRKGFTLIELLAVIVILAVIALIATPTVLGIINTAKKGAAQSSALGYIDAIDKTIALNNLEDEFIYYDGTYYLDDLLGIKIKGNKPDNAAVIIDKNVVKEAKLCFDKYSIDYNKNKISISNNNYCDIDKKVLLIINGETEEKSIGKESSTTFSFTPTNETNIICNNGAVVSYEDNTITLTSILGNTTCKINNTLEDSINNLDNTENYILMLKDETINNSLEIASNKNVILNLNGNNLISNMSLSNYVIKSNGNITLLGKDGSIGGTSHSVLTDGGSLTINGGSYLSMYLYNTKIDISNSIHTCSNNVSNCYPIMLHQSSNGIISNIESSSQGKALGINTSSTGNIIVEDSTFICPNDNCVWIAGSGIFDIRNTIIKSKGYSITKDKSGILNIYNCNFENIDGSITTSPLIRNVSSGTINIYGGNYKSYNSTSTVRSVVVNDKNGIVNIYNGYFYSESGATLGNLTTGTLNVHNGEFVSSANHNIWNASTGIVNIYNGTLSGTLNNIVNVAEGTVNIKGGIFNVASPGLHGSINNRAAGTINICSGQINGLDSLYDLYNEQDGYIYYTSNVELKNSSIYDTNTTTHTILKNDLTCD